MTQAILTKTLYATNDITYQRIKATANAGSIIIEWDDALGIEENHKAAALELAKKYEWDDHSNYVGGSSPKADEFYFVAIDKRKGR